MRFSFAFSGRFECYRDFSTTTATADIMAVIMDAIGIGILAMVLSVPMLFVVWWRWQRGKVKKAKQWPKTEGTIQSGAIEVVAQTKFNTIRLPVFAFSYQVQGEYYSGRFALMPYTVAYDESLIDRMIGRKLIVCHDPAHPDRWLIPDETIDGYKVEQKMGPHFIGYYLSDTGNHNLTTTGLNA
jgi:Protein of unknown function (DUF3592)